MFDGVVERFLGDPVDVRRRLGVIDEDGKQAEMHYDMAACAEMSQQYETVPQMIAEAMAALEPGAREDALYQPENKMLWYKMSVGSGGLLAQCFECMRVCPLAVSAPLADPIRRAAARDAEAGG